MADNDLNEVFEETMIDATVITVPIDDTLQNSGEAADAKAVGDALALKADASSVVAITVNGQSADNQGHIIIDGTDIKMSSTDNTTLKAAIEANAAKNATTIPMSSEAGAQTISEAISESVSKTASEITMSSDSETTIAQKIAAMDTVASANSSAISVLNGKTAESIKMSTTDDTMVKTVLDSCVKSVNGEHPDSAGNVQVNHAMTADNLTSSKTQQSAGEWTRRTSGGSAPIATGKAWLSVVRGSRVHTGYSAEVWNWTYTAAPREQGEAPLEVSVDKDTFIAEVETSTTMTITYTDSWSVTLATYGVTVTGTPVSGDQIVITWTAENRGTITQSNPQKLVSTGWNLYDHTKTYAVGLKYAESATYRIAGTYTAVKFSSTLDGTKTTITPDDGLFSISANGYIWVEGGNSTDTEVFMTWTDWMDAADAPDTFEAYSESVIDISELMSEHFANGLLQVGDVRDEIDFNTGLASSKVERLSYSAENLAAAIATGRTYECDTNYIYLERATAVQYDLDDYTGLTGEYDANDHGLEMFTGTSIAVYAVVVYGNNLKNKLEVDVVQLSAQTLTSSQQTQVRTNIGAASASDVSTLSGNLVTQDLGYSNSNGYVKMSNGLLIQWGDASIPVGSDRVQITFPKSYNYHVPSIIFTPVENNNASGATGNLRIWQPAYTSFYVYNKSGNVTSDAIKFKWVAIGTYTNI